MRWSQHPMVKFIIIALAVIVVAFVILSIIATWGEGV